MLTAALLCLATWTTPAPADIDRCLAVVDARADLAGQQPWPGFDPTAVPLAVSDGEHTLLVGHPAPPDGFALLAHRPDVFVLDGRHPSVTANTSVDLAGTPTSTLLLVEGSSRAPRDLAAIAAHEAFHVYQRRFPTWFADESQLFVYPFEDAEALTLRRLETLALERALAAEHPHAWAARALVLRAERFARLPDGAVGYERGLELVEGLAQCVEDRCRGEPAPFPAGGYAAEDLRSRAYQSGAAWARLLDQLDPGWEAAVTPEEAIVLDERVADVLGNMDVAPAPLDEATVTATRQRAQAEVAEVVAGRTARREAYEQRSGPSLEVLVAGGRPLSPQGFDPLNVRRLDERFVLHERFLKLERHDLRLELLDQHGLTTGAGDHPLFAGVTRLLCTGLAERPMVEERDGVTLVSAPGIAITTVGANVTTSDEDRVVITLP